MLHDDESFQKEKDQSYTLSEQEEGNYGIVISYIINNYIIGSWYSYWLIYW